MKLTATILCNSPYMGKSKFPFWTNIKAGEKLTITLELISLNSGRRIYSPTYNIKNEKGNTFRCTNGELLNYLEKLVYEQI